LIIYLFIPEELKTA
jgi:hypothetical protein